MALYPGLRKYQKYVGFLARVHCLLCFNIKWKLRNWPIYWVDLVCVYCLFEPFLQENKLYNSNFLENMYYFILSEECMKKNEFGEIFWYIWFAIFKLFSIFSFANPLTSSLLHSLVNESISSCHVFPRLWSHGKCLSSTH